MLERLTIVITIIPPSPYTLDPLFVTTAFDILSSFGYSNKLNDNNIYSAEYKKTILGPLVPGPWIPWSLDPRSPGPWVPGPSVPCSLGPLFIVSRAHDIIEELVEPD